VAPPPLPRQRPEPEPTRQPTIPVASREQITEPLASVPANITINLVTPEQEQQAPVVVVQSPTPVAAEKTYVVLPPVERRETERFERQPRVESVPESVEQDIRKSPESVPSPKQIQSEIAPIPDQKTINSPDENNTPEPTKTIPFKHENNTPEELNPSGEQIDSAVRPVLKKVGRGRQRRYDELGIDDVESIQEVVLFRHQFGYHLPGLSQETEEYYELYYFKKPKRGEKFYDRHIKCWERRTRWISGTDQA
jgi:hypothetical protein